MTNFKVGVIGGGGGQGQTWCRRIKQWKAINGNNLDLIAIADPEKVALERAATKFGVKPYNDYIELMDKEKPDIVIIATPHYLHAPMVVEAAKRGINTLSEKPMAINLKQADDMIAAVNKYKTKAAIGFQHRSDPLFVGLKNMIDSGDLGFIYQINMIFHWYRTEDYYLNSSPVPENADSDWEGWRGHWKTEGAGAIANQIIHFMDFFQWMSPSPIKSVMAAQKIAKHTLVETDDNTNAIVEFQNDSMGLLQAGVAYQYGKEEEYDIYGTEGAVIRRQRLKGLFGLPRVYEDMRKPEIKKKKSIYSYMPKILDMNKDMFKHFLDAIITDDPSKIICDVNSGRKSVELMRGILLSQKQQKKITFPFEDPVEQVPELVHTWKDPKYA